MDKKEQLKQLLASNGYEGPIDFSVPSEEGLLSFFEGLLVHRESLYEDLKLKTFLCKVKTPRRLKSFVVASACAMYGSSFKEKLKEDPTNSKIFAITAMILRISIVIVEFAEEKKLPTVSFLGIRQNSTMHLLYDANTFYRITFGKPLKWVVWKTGFEVVSHIKHHRTYSVPSWFKWDSLKNSKLAPKIVDALSYDFAENVGYIPVVVVHKKKGKNGTPLNL